MFLDFFYYLIDFLKGAAPISIIINLVWGSAMLILGLYFLKRQQQTKGYRIGGWACVIVGVMAYLGAGSNLIFSQLIF